MYALYNWDIRGGKNMKNKMIIYISKDGQIKVDVNIQNEDIWMSQDIMAKLYGTTKNNISIHLKNIFNEGELDKNSVVKKILTTASDNKQYSVLNYNLDAIIAVGYRINSKNTRVQNFEKNLKKYEEVKKIKI